MKFGILSNMTLLAVGVLVLPIALSRPAVAALGGDLSSVQADQAKMKGSIRTSQPASSAYTVHEISSPNQVTVREYVSSAGKVFGVAWNGQFRPDLHQVLGDYFSQASQALDAQKSSQHGRRPMRIEQPGLFVEMTGHMRAFSGRAYVPDMLPAGVRAEEVR
jgi:uncharacterized protein DUF2844